MRYRFHPEARLEYKDAIMYYERTTEGMGAKFYLEVETAIQRILDSPKTWPKQSHNVRRYLVHKFPYQLVYKFEDDMVTIIAVMHNSRRPGYWVTRLHEEA